MSLISSGWASLEHCHMNNSNVEVVQDIVSSDCHMTDDMEKSPNNEQHSCENCNHCIPSASLEVLKSDALLHLAQVYSAHISTHTYFHILSDSPPPRA